MKYIYINNYLFLPREKKFEFLKFIYSFKRFKVANQKVVLNDNSLILELTSNSSINIAKKCIDLFFKNKKNIKSFLVDKISIEKNTLYLSSKDQLIKKVEL